MGAGWAGKGPVRPAAWAIAERSARRAGTALPDLSTDRRQVGGLHHSDGLAAFDRVAQRDAGGVEPGADSQQSIGLAQDQPGQARWRPGKTTRTRIKTTPTRTKIDGAREYNRKLQNGKICRFCGEAAKALPAARWSG